MRRLLVLVAACVLAALTAPAAAAPRPASTAIEEVAAMFDARGGSNRMFVQLTPPPVKGYRFTVFAFKAGPRAKTELSINFARSGARGTQSQISDFSWKLPARALRVASDLKPVSLDTRRGMGNNGLVDMRLTGSHGYLRVPAEEGCSGEISVRSGRFGGRFRFNARDEYFKRISMRGVPMLVYREHDYRCPGRPQEPPPVCPENLQLEAVDEEAGAAVTAWKTVEGRVDQRFLVVRELETGIAAHAISVSIAVPEAFEASDDLTSASVDGDAAGPWLSGDLSYVAPPASDGEDESCGPYRSSSGLVTGDYTGHFDSLGDVTVATTGVPATLRREI